ncbi:bromo-adjacent-like proteiny (BAH) domain-containing protein [Forsythia ovata]|uniref:Bromo-adjacent-like proteiny (BAH) domain-containing protein n=1 Tax=Forsythia ovata TaxID=205694 RepID=A0ABD1RNM4_9LAMI
MSLPLHKVSVRGEMRNRRFAQVATSEDEDDVPPASRRSVGDENQRRRKKVHLDDDEEFEVEEENSKETKKKEEILEPEAKIENEEEEEVEAQPIGDVVRVSGKGKGKKNHYQSFEYDGITYDLEDPVLLVPENGGQKPYVAIIKDITRTQKGAMMVTGQWFYRPEEAEKRGGENWKPRDTRELFYSFHRDEVPAESVMHKCVVHFIPLNKQIPKRKQHPGFIVQKVYDTEQRRLFKLTDKDYEENKQHELDILVQKTISRIGDIPDLEPENTVVDQEDQTKNKRLLRRRNVSPLDVPREGEGISRPHQSLKAETPGSTAASTSEYYAILSNHKVLTGETQRDKWLEKLLQAIQFICTPADSRQNDGNEKGGAGGSSTSDKSGGSNRINGSQEKTPNGVVSFHWPDAAVPAIASLEKAGHDALSSDFLKYNQKMRQLTFNLKSNAVLARRFLNGELEPPQILNMSPNELKEGLTAEEIASNEPEESEHMQMTDARCNRCMEKQVGLIDIIHAGHSDRYQLECVACGNTWYASRDDASALTIEGPSSAGNVGTAPLATSKFEDVEKRMLSPRCPEKGASDVLKKTTEAYIPVLDNQKSFNKTKDEDNPATTNCLRDCF